jgi:hypothetical protein
LSNLDKFLKQHRGVSKLSAGARKQWLIEYVKIAGFD